MSYYISLDVFNTIGSSIEELWPQIDGQLCVHECMKVCVCVRVCLSVCVRVCARASMRVCESQSNERSLFRTS